MWGIGSPDNDVRLELCGYFIQPPKVAQEGHRPIPAELERPPLDTV
jgi:hypothetical protein